MAKDNPIPDPLPQVAAAPSEAPVKTKPDAFKEATYALIGLEDHGEEIYIPLLSRSYTRLELQNPCLLELLVLQGWKHVRKTV